MAQRHIATVICGNAGVGKSTLGAQLAKELGAALVDIDTCTERLARLVMTTAGLSADDRDSDDYKRLLREPVYETMFDIARENLAHVHCVLVAPFTRERRRATWPTELATRLDARIEIVFARCSDEERRRRIEARANPRDAGKLASWDDYVCVGEDPPSLPFEHRVVDTTLRLIL